MTPSHLHAVGAILAQVDFLDEQNAPGSSRAAQRLVRRGALLSIASDRGSLSAAPAEVIVSEIGTDMSVFPTPMHPGHGRRQRCNALLHAFTPFAPLALYLTIRRFSPTRTCATINFIGTARSSPPSNPLPGQVCRLLAALK